MKHFATKGLDTVQKSLWISCHFGTENYTWRLVIIENVLISCILLISLDQNVSVLFVNNIQKILRHFEIEKYT